MLDEGVLFEHYERTLKPRVRALEKHREALLAAWRRAAVLVSVPGFVLWMTAGSRGRMGALALLAGIALVVGLVVSGRQLLGDKTLTWSAYRQRFKRDVVSQVFRLVCPQGTYTPHAGISTSACAATRSSSRRARPPGACATAPTCRRSRSRTPTSSAATLSFPPTPPKAATS